MLAIVASERCYVSDLLEKLSYTKEESPNKSEVYKCTYKTHEFIILVSGYGKVNIASNLRYICDKYNIRVILSIGTAGALTDEASIFSSVIPNTTAQFDVDFMPNGFMEGQIPGLDKATYKTNEDLIECLKRASNVSGISYLNDAVASSDMFVSNYNLASSIRREYNACASDCESGVVGEYSFVNEIPYASLRVISNLANNNGIKQYNLYDHESSSICQRITYKFLKEFYEA